MLMHLTVEIPMHLIQEAAEEQKKTNCARKQAVFDLFPGDEWRITWCCGTNMGRGSDTGYGIGHTCRDGCKIRIPMVK